MRSTHDVSPRVAQCLLMFGVLVLSSGAQSAEIIGRGYVGMTGSILEAPCDIEVGDRDQALVMDTFPLSELALAGRGPQRDFSIRLVGCYPGRTDLESDRRRFAVTFDGQQERDYFGVIGSAQGIALVIRDALGAVAEPGRPLPERALASGEKQLDYTVAVVANQQPLRAGDYRSVIRFKMDYY
ncbi:fimbrial protein [Pseudomonas sp. EggHat1]|uniref:fimbrial protein n=1 Tax=Pseudomonas sp. EggHat1 TaxID=2761624 RepID=UPI0018664C25|nr:fimbrial protein [Pseudomonas sp. EggHat1]